MANESESERKTRDLVASAYFSKAWKDKVKKMTYEQIEAIYMRLKLQGKIK